MASPKTRLTELGTAVGLVLDTDARWPDGVAALEIAGIPRERWQPTVVPVAEGIGPERELLLRAVDNGRAFRRDVLHGRRPEHIEWTGGDRATWASDIPRDLTVDGVWFIQAKYDSRCVLNTSPSNLVDGLLAEDEVTTRGSWYVEVALSELQTYYERVRARAASTQVLRSDDADGLPDDVRDLTRAHAATLRATAETAAHDAAVGVAYDELCHAVSVETARRWQRRLHASTPAGRTRMLFRMLRIAGGPYWLLGTRGTTPVRLVVGDTRSWRSRYDLRSFEVVAARSGQPQVDWRAVVRDREAEQDRTVAGFCELRWSHGKLSGNPECKVQVTTALADIPGYGPLTAHPVT